ncbi:MAG: SH3 domain-containing protein [Thermomicrobiales bacterium]
MYTTEPISDADGVVWYGVTIGGLTGYVVGGYLAETTPASDPAAVDLAQTAAAETADAAAPPAPAASLADVPANPVATADLNLRAGPSYDDAVLTVIPAGTALTPTGDFSAGFAGVTYGGQFGWVDTTWLGAAGAASPMRPSSRRRRRLPMGRKRD